jgi:hypothetical protein
MSRTVAHELVFRAATPDDAAFAADVMTAVTPRVPWDPSSLRYWWSQPDEFIEFARFIVVRAERPVGFAQIDHARWEIQPERYATIRGDFVPANRDAESLGALLTAMELRATREGARQQVRQREEATLAAVQHARAR